MAWSARYIVNLGQIAGAALEETWHALRDVPGKAISQGVTVILLVKHWRQNPPPPGWFDRAWLEARREEAIHKRREWGDKREAKVERRGFSPGEAPRGEKARPRRSSAPASKDTWPSSEAFERVVAEGFPRADAEPGTASPLPTIEEELECVRRAAAPGTAGTAQAP